MATLGFHDKVYLFEQALLATALRAAGGNKTEAARLLRIDVHLFHYLFRTRHVSPELVNDPSLTAPLLTP